MKHRDEIYIAVMTFFFCCAMFAVYAVVPKDAAVAAKAKATVTEAPETAAEAEAIRSSQAEDAGFYIYTEDSNYDYDASDSSDSSDTVYTEPEETYTPDSTQDSNVVDEGNYEQGDYVSSDQITYPSEGGTDTSQDPAQDNYDSGEGEWEDWSNSDYVSDDTYSDDTYSGDYVDEDIYTEY